ncbi:MAG: ABC-type transporter, integral rane subunit [Clostridiales bacterium]|jgi:arabinogalactan oligomer/maltooligosaccharide transport system permease protein|nr:ABC-type transporter, integral rane subunit [Clostridiales bacterium]
MNRAKKSLFLSIFIWGSGQFFVCKQRVKGLMFFAIQCLFIGIELATGYWMEYFMGMFNQFEVRLHGGFFTKGVWGLLTLGEVPGAKTGDHSMLLMISGIITMIILGIITMIYIWNIKDAHQSGKYIEDNKEYLSTKKYFKKLYSQKFPYIVISPVVVLILFVSIMPMIFSVLTAFTNYTRGNLPPAHLVDWVGLSNFGKLFKVPIWSKTFFSVLSWTLVWTVCSTLSCFFFGMLQALILNSDHIKFKKVFRTIQILPWVMPNLVCLLVFRNILNGQFGPLNQFLLDAGIISQRIGFLSDPNIAKITVIVVNLWLGFGSSMLMISGVLSNLDPSLYEAARTDGATKFQEFRFITFPMIMRVTMPLLVMSFAHNFNNFGAVFFLTKGGPANPKYQIAGDTDILISWIYKLTLDNSMFSMAAVMSILIFVVVGTIAFFNFRNTSAFKEV